MCIIRECHISNSSLSAEQRTLYEKTSPVYSFVLKDENGVVVPGSSLTTLTVTLFDTASRQIINSRNEQDAKNANQVTVNSSGVVTFSMLPADTIIVGNVKPGEKETHALHFRWTWSAGTKAGEHLVELLVVARDYVT